MSTPAVSIVIPNYNYGHYLAECIDSVLRQTYRDWETIVVDDNSTDGSPRIVEDYMRRHPDRRISLLVNSSGPSGTPTPINIGIRRMRGEYFAWLSSDDIFEAEKLAEQVRFLENNPDVGLVHTAYHAIDSEGKRVGDFHPPNEFETDAFTALLDGNFINGNTVLIRRGVLDDVGPFLETDAEYPVMWRAAEYYHWLKIALKFPIACIDRLLHRSRRHEGNAEFNGSSIGPALERMFIRRCFAERQVTVTPEIVIALAGRGLTNLFIETFGRLSEDEQARARALLAGVERDRDRWDIGEHEGVRTLDIARIRSAFHTKDPGRARPMLEALQGLERPQTLPYRSAALARLARMDSEVRA